uniref:[histone H3]-lysine(4) N-trimethyltransferase n=1 Tax=Steinernema glaseri TaxID=37863 RepID=A0A1I8A2X1_9BILA
MNWHSSTPASTSSQLRQEAPRPHHDERHRRSSTSGRPPAPPHHRGRIVNPQTGREEDCKLVLVHDKQPIYRFRGVCPDPFSAFNVTAVRDPRDRDKIHTKTLPQDLPVPDLKLDLNYVGVPEQREVAIFNLNDNVNDSLLKRFCEKVIDPEELMVCYHPSSRKHMKMALVECRSAEDALRFVKYANETELMGSKVSAMVDPLADQLNAEFLKKTGLDLPRLPRRLQEVGDVLEVLRERLRDATRPEEPLAASTGSSPMDCDSEGLSPEDITPAKEPDSPPRTAPLPTPHPATPPPPPPKKVRSRPSRFSDSPEITRGPIPLNKIFVRPPIVQEVPHFPPMASASPGVIRAPPPPVFMPPPAQFVAFVPPPMASWDGLPPPPPVPSAPPAGQVAPAEPPKKERKERVRKCSASGSSSSEEEHRRRSKKKHGRGYRRRSRRRRSSSVSSESSASSEESAESSSTEEEDASEDEHYHRGRRKRSRRYSTKRSEKRKVTEKIVTHKRQVITSKDASTVKDTYIHIVSRRFEKSPERKETPDSDDLPIIEEQKAPPAPEVVPKQETSANLGLSDMLVMEDVSSDEHEVPEEPQEPKEAEKTERRPKEASHTWSSTSDTSTPSEEDRRRRSRNESPAASSKKSKRSRRDSDSPKRHRSHKEKRRREKSPSPTSSKEQSRPSAKKKCLEASSETPPPPPPPQAPPMGYPMPTAPFPFPPPNLAFPPPFPKFDASKPPPTFYPHYLPSMLLGAPPPPLGAPPPYSSMYPAPPPETSAPANDLTSRLAELFPEQMNETPKSESTPREEESTPGPPKEEAPEEEPEKAEPPPPPKKKRTRKSRFDMVSSPPPSLPPPSVVLSADGGTVDEEAVEKRVESIRNEVFRRIRAELKEQVLKDLLTKRDTYTFEELETRWDRLMEEKEKEDKEKEERGEPLEEPEKENKENEATPVATTTNTATTTTTTTTQPTANWALDFESMFRSTSLRLLPRIQKVKNPAGIAAMKRRQRRRRERSASAVSRSSSEDRASSSDSEPDELEGLSPISEKSESPVKPPESEEEEEVGLMSSGQEDNDEEDDLDSVSGRLNAVAVAVASDVSDEEDEDEEDEDEDEEEEEGDFDSEGEEVDVESLEGPGGKRRSRRSPYIDAQMVAAFQAGCDEEDVRYLYKAFQKMTTEEPNVFGRPVPFGRYPEIPPVRQLNIPKKTERKIYYFDDPELEGVAPHKSGCARTEGFYRTKKRRTFVRRPEEETRFKDTTEISAKDETSVRQNNSSRRELKAANRRNQTVMGDASGDMFKVNQLKFRKKMIKFARSKIHGWGLYAMEAIAADEMIVEYVGELIRPAIADEREKSYEKRGIGSSYLFRIDRDSVIDATKKGNFARFINHSCQPNCYARVVTLEGEKRIVIYSKTYIDKGDEITYDYKFPIEEEKIECLCGAPQCRRFLN